jgi:tripartite-type tricarboxylate transporter receptor subunit TctC
MLVALSGTMASAETVEEFYHGKTIKLIVGSGAGGGSDALSRIFAKYFTQHMPGKPAVVVQNLPGAGGVTAAAQIFNTQPRDGTVFASVMRTIPVLPLLTEKPLNYDPLKMSWIGSLNRETNVIVAWHTSPVQTLDDVFKREMAVGTSGPGSDTYVYSVLLNKTLGAKFKIISGYPGGPEIDLAMQRGEVEGRVSITWTSLKTGRSDWLRDKKVRVLAQLGLQREPDLPDVPNVLELVKDPTDRQVYEFLFARQETGRPFVAPPDVPADRLAALRKAFVDAANDREFLAEIQSKGGSIELMSGEELQAFVGKLYKTSPEVIKAAKEVLGQE